MARTFDASGRPLVFADKRTVNKAVNKASRGLKKQERRLRKRVAALDAAADPITTAPKGVLLKRANDPRSSLPSRERAMDELRRRGVVSAI